MKTPKDSYTNINIEYELTDLPLTSLGRVPVMIEVAKSLGIDKLFDKHLNIKLRDRGYSEYELALAVILTLLAGGESLEDADKIRLDEVVGRGHFPHSTTIGDFLRRFTEEEQFEALQRVQDELNRNILRQKDYAQLTLDLDATIIVAEGKKREGISKAFTGDIGFQPFVLFASEPGLVLAHDFRPANVHPGAGAVSLLHKALTVIPTSTRLHLRSDSACYNKEVVQFWDAENRTFTIAADLTKPLLAEIAELPEEAWSPLEKDDAVAQVYYQPTGWPKAYRFVVVRTNQ